MLEYKKYIYINVELTSQSFSPLNQKQNFAIASAVVASVILKCDSHRHNLIIYNPSQSFTTPNHLYPSLLLIQCTIQPSNIPSPHHPCKTFCNSVESINQSTPQPFNTFIPVVWLMGIEFRTIIIR